ncbi:MAG TPA: HepT-like ribonuclease domain-containing protein [Thermoanaerobaculia bacterium]|nr:HepT-like ribonuclease domain-containing protein [Thermoanaerobaculia bacterium]
MNELARLERKTRLWHIEKAANNVISFIGGCTKEQFLADTMLRSAVERELIIIGEAMARAEEVDPELATMISDVPGIIACRNQLVHNYPRIAPDRIWEIITEHVPLLLTEVRALLSAGENPA